VIGSTVDEPWMDTKPSTPEPDDAPADDCADADGDPLEQAASSRAPAANAASTARGRCVRVNGSSSGGISTFTERVGAAP
jgi:hypothetical protein